MILNRLESRWRQLATRFALSSQTAIYWSGFSWLCLLAPGPAAYAATLAESQATQPNQESDRAVVVLFAGRGEDPADPIGLAKLNQRLQKRWGDSTRTLFSSQVFRHSEEEEALNYLENFDDIGALGIVGYSWGGDSAIELAQTLESSESEVPSLIDLLIQIDSVGKGFLGDGDEVLPEAVTKGFNFFQSNPRVPDGSWRERLEERLVVSLVEKTVEGSTNINVEDRFDDLDITHLTIDGDRRLHRLITQRVKKFVIGALPGAGGRSRTFRHPPSPHTTVLSSSNLARSAFAPEPEEFTTEPIPEPSIGLALMGLSLLSLKLLKRQR